MKIDYVANLRLPTYRAHGVQITKMCEQFAALGNEVQLIVPAKRHTIGGSDDPFEIYGLKRNFSYVRIPCLDLLGITYSFSRILYWIDLFSFLTALSESKAIREGSIVYVRDPLLLRPFSAEKHTLVVEVHEIPHHPSRFYKQLSKAHVYVVLTSGLRDELIQHGIPAHRILIAADAVDLEQFAHPESKESARKRLGLPLDKKLAFYIGRLDGWKGVETLYAASQKASSDIGVVIIGGDDDGEVQRLQRQYPNIHFLGNRPYSELQNNQAAADVLILPNTAKNETSARFTSPLKLFTYMTSSVPIVASNLPSLREVVSDEDVYFVTPDDPQALAEGIQKALREPEVAKQKAAHAQAKVQSYTWAARAQAIQDFISHA
jgi:glycosyltransferase involved in cell wall biosynthesis